MPVVLVADDARNVRNVLTMELESAGYDVVEARDGKATYQAACEHRPDIILLDITMPGLDGLQVLERLKTNPETASIPVIMLTAMSAIKGEHVSLGLGAVHYIMKPWTPGALELMMRSALRDVGFQTVVEETLNEHAPSSRRVIRTGYSPLDDKLGGGITMGTLAMVEGDAQTGKSILSQQTTYAALREGYDVAYFNSEHTPQTYVGQLDSIGKDVLTYYQRGHLELYPLEGSAADWDAKLCEDPERLLSFVAMEVERLPNRVKVVVLDSVTNLCIHSRDKVILNFFSGCSRICSTQGRTMVVTVRTYALDERIRSRVQALCETNIHIQAEEFAGRSTKMLQVVRSDNGVPELSNLIAFEVVPGIGMRSAPGKKVRV